MEYKYIITDINNKIFCCIYTSDNTCHYLKPLDSGSVVGNIYVGRVENVVKNINAAFIEIEDKQKCYYSIQDNKTPIFFNEKNNPAICQGDRILVKVITEPLKTKPAKVSSKIELTGNYSVVSNDVKGVHISKKIKSNETITDIKKRVADILIQKQQEAIEKQAVIIFQISE